MSTIEYFLDRMYLVQFSVHFTSRKLHVGSWPYNLNSKRRQNGCKVPWPASQQLRDKDLKLQNKAFGVALGQSLMLLLFQILLPLLSDIRWGIILRPSGCNHIESRLIIMSSALYFLKQIQSSWKWYFKFLIILWKMFV